MCVFLFLFNIYYLFFDSLFLKKKKNHLENEDKLHIHVIYIIFFFFMKRGMLLREIIYIYNYRYLNSLTNHIFSFHTYILYMLNYFPGFNYNSKMFLAGKCRK